MFFKYLLLIPKVVQLNYGLKSGMIFKRTTRGYKHICPFNSKPREDKALSSLAPNYIKQMEKQWKISIDQNFNNVVSILT